MLKINSLIRDEIKIVFKRKFNTSITLLISIIALLVKITLVYKNKFRILNL